MKAKRIAVEFQTHTPGPWHVIPGLIGGDVTILDKYDCHVAKVPTYGAGIIPSQWVAPWHSAGANARLIAAAPDLLEACKLALAQLEALKRSGDAQDWEAFHPLHGGYGSLKSAISKAGGEA